MVAHPRGAIDRQRLGAARAADPRRRQARTHEAILDATMELLAERGYFGLTIEGVASRAGVGKATLYRWWPSKAALVSEAMSRQLETDVPTTGDVRGDLLACLRATIASYDSGEQGLGIAALAADIASDPALLEAFRERFIRRRRARIAGLVAEGVGQGLIPPDVDTSLVIDLWWGTVFFRRIVSGEPVDERTAEQLVDLVLAGRVPRLPAPRGRG
jgi:AcrR family transcriptional regulator